MLIKKIGDATALEVRATGIQYVFAPCIAVIKQHYNSIFFQSHKTFDQVSYYVYCLFIHRFAEIQDGGVAMKATVRILR